MQLCNPLRRRYEVLGNIIVASHCTRISAGCTLPAGKHSHCAWYMGDRRQSCSEPGGAVSPVTMVQAPSVATVLVPPTPIGASSNASPGGHHWQQTHGRGQAWSWDMALGRHRRTPPLCLQQPGPLPADGEHHRVQPDILGCHCCRYGGKGYPRTWVQLWVQWKAEKSAFQRERGHRAWTGCPSQHPPATYLWMHRLWLHARCPARDRCYAGREYSHNMFCLTRLPMGPHKFMPPQRPWPFPFPGQSLQSTTSH